MHGQCIDVYLRVVYLNCSVCRNVLRSTCEPLTVGGEVRDICLPETSFVVRIEHFPHTQNFESKSGGRRKPLALQCLSGCLLGTYRYVYERIDKGPPDNFCKIYMYPHICLVESKCVCHIMDKRELQCFPVCKLNSFHHKNRCISSG